MLGTRDSRLQHTQTLSEILSWPYDLDFELIPIVKFIATQVCHSNGKSLAACLCTDSLLSAVGSSPLFRHAETNHFDM